MPTDIPTQPTDFAKLERDVVKALHRHWKLYLAEGIGLLILGVIAVIVPALATLAATIVFGWLFLFSGIIGLVTTWWMRTAPGFWWSLASAALGVLAGIWLLAQPLAGALSLTFVLIVFFIIEGVATVMFSIEHKRDLSGQWGIMLLSGIVDLVLAVLLTMGLPSTAVWALGLLVGINMIFGGVALVAMALHARDASA